MDHAPSRPCGAKGKNISLPPAYHRALQVLRVLDGDASDAAIVRRQIHRTMRDRYGETWEREIDRIAARLGVVA
jgi:hypothetical protein